MNKPVLWIALTRPDNLVLALTAATVGRAHFSACHLLYEDSHWWKRAQWDTYRPVFDRVDAIGKIETCRGLLDAPRFFRALRERQRGLANLGIAPADVILTLAGITGLSNAVASAYPRVAKVSAMTVKKYLDASRPANWQRYRHTTSSLLQYYVLEPMTGVNRTLHLKPWRRLGGDGVRLERMKAPLEAVYDAILLLSNTGTQLPPGAGPKLRPAPFPNLRELSGLLPAGPETGDEQKRSTVFFGTPFLLVRNLPPEEYATRLNECLDYLRHHYASRGRLVYRPHPAETGERGRLRLEGFDYEDDQEVAELYFLRHAARIEAVYSVSSTVSRVAFNYGLNAYALWRCFPFAPSSSAYFETLMDTVPPEFDVRSLEAAPVAYVDQADSQRAPPFAGAFMRTLLEVTRPASN